MKPSTSTTTFSSPSANDALSSSQDDIPLTPVPSLQDLIKPTLANGTMIPRESSMLDPPPRRRVRNEQEARACLLNTLEQAIALLDTDDFSYLQGWAPVFPANNHYGRNLGVFFDLCHFHDHDGTLSFL